MVRKEYYSIGKVKGLVLDLIKQMYQDTWKPDYIVGINRGGLAPAVMISHFTNLPMYTLDVRLRQGSEPESNKWMAEDAYGYDRISYAAGMFSSAKDILIVDDINDSGATFNWIKEDWQNSMSPDNERWNDVWGKNVKFAVLTENLSSEFDDVNYFVEEVNKAEDDVWIVYPWEHWWGINYEEPYNE
jgi:hypoxanthine phosphoribosyltransferase